MAVGVSCLTSDAGVVVARCLASLADDSTTAPRHVSSWTDSVLHGDSERRRDRRWMATVLEPHHVYTKHSKLAPSHSGPQFAAEKTSERRSTAILMRWCGLSLGRR
jgi:hypothetical protein